MIRAHGRQAGQQPAKRRALARPLRALYAILVRLHPRTFRRHFGDEMLSIFDQTSANRLAFLGDAVFSLLRQWLLRPRFPEPENPPREYLAGAPMFLLLDDDPQLTRGQWIGGTAFSLLSFAAVSFLISQGGNHSAMVIGSARVEPLRCGGPKQRPGGEAEYRGHGKFRGHIGERPCCAAWSPGISKNSAY